MDREQALTRVRDLLADYRKAAEDTRLWAWAGASYDERAAALDETADALELLLNVATAAP